MFFEIVNQQKSITCVVSTELPISLLTLQTAGGEGIKATFRADGKRNKQHLEQMERGIT